MNTPAVTVPPVVIPQSFVADDDENCPRGTTPDAGTGAPLPVVAEVPAPMYRVVAPALVITTDAGPGGTVVSSVGTVPGTLTPSGSIIR
jgi:hypothetical protein